MSQRSKASMKAYKNSQITTNGTNSNTGAKHNAVLEDLCDSMLFISDHLLDEDDMASDSATQVPSQQSVKAYVGSSINTSAVQVAKISVSSAELLALNSTPKQVVAAPGANKMILPIALLIKYTYVSAAYATNTTLEVVWAGSGVPFSINSVIDQTNDVWARAAPSANTNYTSNYENLALNIKVATGNPTAGSGTLKVTVSYYIADLT